MKALALISGGLDSILAVKVVQEAGVEVEGLHFVIPFLQTQENEITGGPATTAAKQLGIKLHYYFCGSDYLHIIENPAHGYGKRMNPCVDCRIYKFKIAHQIMKDIGAAFLVTGEVLDQRPNSQRRDALDITQRDAGIRGLVLRPLSAKHLQPTIPENEGWIDRTKLLDLKGRGRNPQIELAKKFNIQDYSAPAGGCLLTCEEYALKVKDLLTFNKKLTLPQVKLLRVGRHLRLSPETKIIVGKNQAENEQLKQMASAEDSLLELVNYNGPTTLYLGPAKPDLHLAAAITAGFSNAPTGEFTAINIITNNHSSEIQVKPLPRSESRPYFIYQIGG